MDHKAQHHSRHLGSALVLLIAATTVLPARAQGPDGPLPPANLAGVRGAIQLLGQELDNAEQYIVLALRQGQEERSFYKQADAAMGQLRKFNRALNGTATRQQLYKEFKPLSEKIDKLLTHVKNNFALDAPLRHMGRRIRAAQVEVRYNLLLGDTDEGRSRELVQSQASALVAAAEDMNATGQYVLGQDIGQAGLLVNMKALMQATQKFQVKMAAGAMGAELREAFAVVTSAWEMVASGITMTSTNEIVGLYSTMTKMSAAYGRVHRLLAFGGNPPSFQVPD